MRFLRSTLLGFVLLLSAAGYAHAGGFGLDTDVLQRRIEYPGIAVTYGIAGKVLVCWYPADQGAPAHAMVMAATSSIFINAVQQGLNVAYPELSIGTSLKESPNGEAYTFIFTIDSAGGKNFGHVYVSRSGLGASLLSMARGGHDPVVNPADTVALPAMDMFVAVNTDPAWSPGDLQSRIVYPAEAQRENIEGMVIVRVLVGKSGAVLDMHIDHSDNPILALSAIQAVMGTRFTPATQNGKPVAVWVQIPVTFKLS